MVSTCPDSGMQQDQASPWATMVCTWMYRKPPPPPQSLSLVILLTMNLCPLTLSHLLQYGCSLYYIDVLQSMQVMT